MRKSPLTGRWGRWASWAASRRGRSRRTCGRRAPWSAPPPSSRGRWCTQTDPPVPWWCRQSLRGQIHCRMFDILAAGGCLTSQSLPCKSRPQQTLSLCSLVASRYRKECYSPVGAAAAGPEAHASLPAVILASAAEAGDVDCAAAKAAAAEGASCCPANLATCAVNEQPTYATWHRHVA